MQEQRTAARSSSAQVVPTTPPKPRSDSSAPAATDDAARFNRTVDELEARYPLLNPKSAQYNEGATKWVTDRLAMYVGQGRSRADAARQAVADMVAAMAEQARAQQASEAARAQAAKEVLPTLEERLTMGMACIEFQMSGDILGYRSCVERQTSIH